MPFLSKAALVLLVPAGCYTLQYLSFENGLFPLITSFADRRLLPDSITTVPSWLPSQPSLLAGLLGFFWPVITAEKLSLTLNTVPFGSGAAAIWLLTTLEGYRGGVNGLISYTTVYGLLLQIVGLGIIGPLYLALNLFLSKAVSHPTTHNVAVSDSAIISAAPLAIIVGYLVPSVLMSLPVSDHFPLDAKVAFSYVWQLFPLWTNLLVGAFKPFFVSAGPKFSASHLPALRRAYSFFLVIASFGHIVPLAMSVTSVISPHLFTAAALSELHPATIFLPVLEKTTISSVAEGALRFLQWDYAIGGSAYLIWAIGSSSRVTRESSFSSGSILFDALLRSVLFGPAGAALTLIWERDEAILKGEHEKKY